jgi:hypothetical protein
METLRWMKIKTKQGEIHKTKTDDELLNIYASDNTNK